MPLRRPSWWSWIVLVGFTAVNIAFTAIITNRLSQRAIEADRSARNASAVATLAAICNLVTSQEAVWQDAESQVGRNARKSWHDLGVLYRCY